MKIEDLRESVKNMSDEELNELVLKIRKDRRNFGRRKKADTADQLLLDIDNLEHIIAKHDKGGN